MLLSAVSNEQGSRLYIEGGGPLPTFILRLDLTGIGQFIHRVAIKASDPQRAIALGSHAYYSSDGGVTWTEASGFTALGEIIAIRFFGPNNVVAITKNAILRSGDNGQSWSNATGTWAGNPNFRDILPLPTSFAVLVSNTAANAGAKIYETPTFGTYTQKHDLSSFLLTNEAPRRIEAMPGGSNLILVTSHRILSIAGYDTTPTSTILFDYWKAMIDAGYPTITERGYASSGNPDADGLMNEVLVETGRIWVGGQNSVSARSLDGGATWALGNVNIAESGTSPYSLFHASGGFGIIYQGSQHLAGDPVPNNPGVFKSTNLGVNFNPFSSFFGSDRLVHMASNIPPSTLGCSDPSACNTQGDLTADDRSCTYATLLTDCSNGDTMSVSSPEVAMLNCRSPRFAINIGGFLGRHGNRSITVLINGTQVFQYTKNFLNSLQPAAEQMEEFLGGLVAYINQHTIYQAQFIPPSQNALVPGSTNGIYISCPSCHGGTITVVNTLLKDVTSDQFVDNGSAGKIVELVEYPGRCWRVCGSGNCVQAQAVTISSIYDTCDQCLPASPSGVCFDCSTSVVRQNGEYLIPTKEDLGIQCVVAGENLSVNLRAVFQSNQPTDLVPVNAGSVCLYPAPVSVEFEGDVLSLFPVGSSISFNTDATSNSVAYNVGAATYEPGNDRTTVTTQQNCLSSGAIDSVTAFYDCSCGVLVTIERITEDGALVLENRQYHCEDGQVNQLFSWMVPDYGKYRITIHADSCGSVRTCTYWMGSCEAIRVVETGCHEYRIETRLPVGAPVGAPQAHTVRITDVADSKVIFNRTVLLPFGIITPGDGVYDVTVLYNGVPVSTVRLVDLCDIKGCRSRLATDIFCGKNDPCDTNCERSEDNERARTEVARINLMLSELEDLLGVAQFRSTQQDLLVDNTPLIARLMRSVRSLYDTCGVCKKA